MAQAGSNKKTNKLVAASCAAVMAVYVAGYSRTQSAANRLATQIAAERRATAPTASNFPYTRISRTPAVPEGVLTRVEGTRSLPTMRPAAPTRTETEPVPVVRLEPSSSVVSGIAPETGTAVPPAIPPAAPAPVEPAAPLPPPPPPSAPTWKDGVYTGWGYSRHGNIEAAVVIEGGRIASATISQCRTRYSCSVIDRLPPQVAQRQSPEVDYVSGATESANAFYGAVAEALSKAK